MVALLVEALRYKPEGRGIDSRWGSLLNPSGPTVALGSTRYLTVQGISAGVVKAAGA